MEPNNTDPNNTAGLTDQPTVPPVNNPAPDNTLPAQNTPPDLSSILGTATPPPNQSALTPTPSPWPDPGLSSQPIPTQSAFSSIDQSPSSANLSSTGPDSLSSVPPILTESAYLDNTTSPLFNPPTSNPTQTPTLPDYSASPPSAQPLSSGVDTVSSTNPWSNPLVQSPLNQSASSDSQLQPEPPSTYTPSPPAANLDNQSQPEQVAPIPTFTPPEANQTIPTEQPLAPDYSQPQPAVEPEPSAKIIEPAPTDLSHLIPTQNGNGGNEGQPVYAPPIMQPETLVVPGNGNGTVNPTLPTENNSNGFPLWLIGVAVALLLAVAGASGYFILGIGQPQNPKATTSLPAVQQPSAPLIQQNTVQTTTASGSTTFGQLSGSQPTASSAADLIRQRQQAR